MPMHDGWPALPLAAWRPTCESLHMMVQIAGKLRLALSPREPQWAHVALYVTPLGLTTGPIPYHERTFQVDFDLTAHLVEIVVSNGQRRMIPLEPRSIAEFYGLMHAALHELAIDVRISTLPSEVANPIRFDQDTTHTAYEREPVERFHRALVHADSALQAFRAPFRGRHSRVQFYFGTFDLAYARYSGRPAAPPNDSLIMKNAMDAQEICSGFWPGDDRFPEPAFWCYAYPKPNGAENVTLRPQCAEWNTTMGECILRYDDVRSAASPEEALREFFESSFAALSKLADWPDI